MQEPVDILETVANALRHYMRELGVGGYNVYIFNGPTDPLHRNYLSVCMGAAQPKAVLSVDGTTKKWELSLQMARNFHYNYGYSPTKEARPDKEFPVDFLTADVDYLVEVMMWHVAGVDQTVSRRSLA